MKKLLYRSTLVALALATILVLVGYSFWIIDPVGFRLIVFQPIREVAFFARELEIIRNWDKIETILLPKPKTVKVPPTDNDTIDIVADLWTPAKTDAAPAMILLHGSAPWGRKAGLIQLLGYSLQQRGWYALAPDARGFGDTGNPKNVNDPVAWEVSTDIQRTVEYIVNVEGVDPLRIYIFGHSLGANYALEAGLNDKRVRALLLVGPSRYPQRSQINVSLWNRTRFAADRKLKHPIDNAVLEAGSLRWNIALLAEGPLGRPDHMPILLIDGEYESVVELTYLRNIVSKIAPPIEYQTLPMSGHYCGVINFFGANRIYYRPTIYGNLLELILNYSSELDSQ